VENKDIFNEKLNLLKFEISIVDERLKHIISHLWKIRQFSMTLWLAAVGVGLGVVSDNQKTNFSILTISIFVPMVFQFIDARLCQWFLASVLREKEIRRFISEKEYILPATNIKMSFNDCLKEESFSFPIYDLTGKLTFGNSKYFQWQTSLKRAIVMHTPLFFYGLQILASALFIGLEYNRITGFELWWLPPLIILSVFTMLYFIVNIRKRILEKRMAKHFEESAAPEASVANSEPKLVIN
jgi:hypothetical protein